MSSNLLVSAAVGYQPHYVHFVTIISQLLGQWAKIFEAQIGPRGFVSVLIDLERQMAFAFICDFLQEGIKKDFGNNSALLDTTKHTG